MLLFTSLATLLSALCMIVYENLEAAAQVSFGIVAVPALTLLLKIVIRFGKNNRTTGILIIAAVAFVNLIVVLFVGWETWTLITDYSTELWTALILWGEAFALNLVVEIPGNITQHGALY